MLLATLKSACATRSVARATLRSGQATRRDQPGEVFGAAAVIAEIHERWGDQLRHAIEPRSVSSRLRHWSATGRLQLVRDGRSYSESLYTIAEEEQEEEEEPDAPG